MTRSLESLWGSVIFWRSLTLILLLAGILFILAYRFRDLIKGLFLKSAIKRHDKGIFQGSDPLLSEKELFDTLSEIENTHCYHDDFLLSGTQFYKFFEDEKNDYINKNIKKAVKELTSSLNDLLWFLGKHFFVSPSDQIVEKGNWRFKMYPEDEDNLGKTSIRYKETEQKLYVLTEIVRTKYSEYRSLVRNILNL